MTTSYNAFFETTELEFQLKLRKIHDLLAEAYEHAFADPETNAKSSEGAVSIELPPYFWQEANDHLRPGISIYSYVLGPSRNHDFDNIDDALEAVRDWHWREMTL